MGSSFAKKGLAIATVLFALGNVVACKKDRDATQAASGPQTSAQPSEAQGAVAAGDAKGPASFDIGKVPISTAPLGEFPYIQLPDGYMPHSRHNVVIPFGEAPFWDGSAYVVKEGRLVSDGLTVRENHSWSNIELERNLAQVIETAGGVLVSETNAENFPYDAYTKVADSHDFNLGRGKPSSSYRSKVYVIRREDREIWIDFGTDSSQGRWMVLETSPMKMTAGLLPASELKKQIDAAGKVALQVNFATDKTDVLPDSLPQIEQVVALLKEDPALKLAVNGHTDDSGDAAHNQPLSEGRAKAVVALLVGQGIDAARLTAAGFGSAQPVAENTTAEGKAKNRRVELVKR